MRVVIQDASILIDLAEGELLTAWFSLGIETLTTSLVWREVTRRSHKSQLKKFTKIDKLDIISINAEVMTEIVVLKHSLPAALTLQDASVLHLADKRQGVLLAGDDLHHVGLPRISPVNCLAVVPRSGSLPRVGGHRFKQPRQKMRGRVRRILYFKSPMRDTASE